jgi:hypothetical protein
MARPQIGTIETREDAPGSFWCIGRVLILAGSLYAAEVAVYLRRRSMARYGKKAGKKVKRALHERKKGTLRSGRSKKKVKSRKQAIAIGLSEARRSGAKVPRKKSSSRKKK